MSICPKFSLKSANLTMKIPSKSHEISHDVHVFPPGSGSRWFFLGRYAAVGPPGHPRLRGFGMIWGVGNLHIGKILGHTYIRTYIHTYIHTDTHTETDRQTDRQKDRQTYIHTYYAMISGNEETQTAKKDLAHEPSIMSTPDKTKAYWLVHYERIP